MHIHHPASLNLPRSPHYSPVRLYPVSLHRRRFFRRGGKRKRENYCDRGKSHGWQGGGGKKHTQRNLTRCGEAILSRQTSQEISSGNLRRGTPARAEISSPEIQGKLGTSRLYVHARAYMYCMCERASVCMCHHVRAPGILGHLGVSEGSEGDPGDRLIARPIVGADQRAKASRTKMRAIFDIRYVYRGTFIVRARARDVLLTSVYICYRD